MIEGITSDFVPTRDRFHVTDGRAHSQEVREVHEVHFDELKAVFFVKRFSPDTAHDHAHSFPSRHVRNRHSRGRKIVVEFEDGEVACGYTLSYSQKGLGFYMFPPEPDGNHTKVFVIHGSIKRVRIDALPSTRTSQHYPR